MGAANEVPITICLVGDCHAAPKIACATFTDCNVPTVKSQAINCRHNFELSLTVFGGDNDDTYALYYTHIILA